MWILLSCVKQHLSVPPVCSTFTESMKKMMIIFRLGKGVQGPCDKSCTKFNGVKSAVV